MLAWGLVFLGTAVFFSRFQGEGLLDLTFRLPNYVYGAMLGAIVLARIGIGRISSVAVGFVVAIALTLWLSSQNVAFFFWCPVAGLAMILTVLLLERKSPEWRGVVNV